MKIRVEFLKEKDSGITRAYIWEGMRLLGRHPYPGELTHDEKKNAEKYLIKKFTEGKTK